jgi:ribosome maturation factor RimP
VPADIDASAVLLSCLQPHFPSWRNGRAAPIFYEMTQVYERERELHREVAATVQSRLADVEVLAVELGGPDRLTVYVDHPEGVDHALCERVTGVLRDYLDRYTLDVSSPGFQRPLRTPSHFAGVRGKKVAVRTSVEVGGRSRFRGEVLAAGDRDFTLSAAGGESIRIPYDAVARGNLIDEG